MNVIFDMIDAGRSFHEWVDYPGFKSLYVRYGRRYYGSAVVNVFDIANVTASKPGNGAFTRLVRDLRERYPDLVIHVECVHEQRFRNRLIRMGFNCYKDFPISFWLDPSTELVIN